MLEKPAITDEVLIHRLNEGFGTAIQAISFLPIGADENTAVYKAIAPGDKSYFAKLRRGIWNRASVLVPAFMADSGIKQTIPTLRTLSGDLSLKLDIWVVTLHPFIQGHHGYEQKMSPAQWVEFGSALKQFHSQQFPAAIIGGIPREDFSAQWHGELRMFLARIKQEKFVDPVSAELAAFLNSKRNEILSLIERLEDAIQPLRRKAPAFVLCHADIHGWNLLIADGTEDLYIVDWDTLVFAPKERDLMFIGSGLADSGYTPAQEAKMFFSGYGQTTIDSNAITYYRCVRIIEDLVVYCRQIFLSEVGEEDRRQALEYVRSNFRPNGTFAMAMAID